ncbi:hypothetical protein ABZ897_41545 [Nonomuraea sp. NPDC046802]|uniref:hypothetical protein n=1 Tax=Nonomuraea sp. NPDC046802 TaxID=3154919 RepID=UPI0033CD329C
MTKNSARSIEIRARQAKTGEAYNAAARALDHERQADAEPAVFVAGLTRDGRPWVSSCDGDPHHDVNPACGHHLRALCGGRGSAPPATTATAPSWPTRPPWTPNTSGG